MMYAGDETIADQDQDPESVGDDPLDHPCDQCGADSGDKCRASCVAYA